MIKVCQKCRTHVDILWNISFSLHEIDIKVLYIYIYIYIYVYIPIQI